MIYTVEGNEISIPNDVCSVYVAASNSTEADKRKADYVCLGSNDQEIIQSAIDVLSATGGTVHLAYGDYYIDGWSVNSSTLKIAIAVKNTSQKSVKIVGSGVPMAKVGAHDIDNTAVLRVSSTALNQLTGEETVAAIIGFNSTTRTQYFLGVESIGIMLADNQHSVIGIDGKFFNGMGIKNVRIGIVTETYSGTDSADDYDLPVIGCIGIRGLNGSNAGAGYTIDQCGGYGLGVAFDLNGEHLVMQQCVCRYCDYSYRFGYDNTIGINLHDQTLINCCHEFTRRFPVFIGSNRRQAVNLYDYNVEKADSGKFAHISKAVEDTDGKTCGKVYYTIGSASTWTNIDEDFFETGYGSAFETQNNAFLNA